MAHDVMDSFSSILKVLGDGFYVNHGVDWLALMFLQGMNPHINEPVDFLDWIFSQLSLFLLLLHPF